MCKASAECNVHVSVAGQSADSLKVLEQGVGYDFTCEAELYI